MSELIVDDLADVRAGDKGDTLILAVLPRDGEAYALLAEVLTPDAVAGHYAVTEPVERTELPHLPALVFRVPSVLAGGVTGYSGLDGHGKALGYHLLMLRLEKDG
ncbi:hypothetical protein J2S40_000265 [Nocardioides luteus]|uniref:AtuA-like ferredoxin-fold domain-containing protein n=1 Tax=Nocardioides luteus TaxID=1844 RepID=A0ABQ5STZ7_9ACTN|nr:hypothetical protein [Nocardioides luteus]MDR7309207.1 hypothetical protein [Nocardioides luteus]GGR49088.1 hypothetical protein GCM10010197_13650 [Nocardioides luteus]GLJ67612.1 hypothetical protein GCM10017579_16480 [Nocardioides luteus]